MPTTGHTGLVVSISADRRYATVLYTKPGLAGDYNRSMIATYPIPTDGSVTYINLGMK